MHKGQVLLLLIHSFPHSWLTNEQKPKGKIQVTWKGQEITVCLNQAKALARLKDGNSNVIPVHFEERCNGSFFFISPLTLRSRPLKLSNFSKALPSKGWDLNLTELHAARQKEWNLLEGRPWYGCAGLHVLCRRDAPLWGHFLPQHCTRSRAESSMSTTLRSQCSPKKDIPCFFMP